MKTILVNKVPQLDCIQLLKNSKNLIETRLQVWESKSSAKLIRDVGTFFFDTATKYGFTSFINKDI